MTVFFEAIQFLRPEGGGVVLLFHCEEVGTVTSRVSRPSSSFALNGELLFSRSMSFAREALVICAASKRFGELAAHLTGRAVKRFLAAEDKVKLARGVRGGDDGIARCEGIGVAESAVGNKYRLICTDGEAFAQHRFRGGGPMVIGDLRAVGLLTFTAAESAFASRGLSIVGTPARDEAACLRVHAHLVNIRPV